MLLVKGEPADATGSRLRLFAAEPVRLLIIELYELLAGGQNKADFIHLHVAMQKALLANFTEVQAQRAAADDWLKAAEESEDFIQLEEFALFMFEIAALWTTPHLYSQLVFLGSVFLAVAGNSGNIESIENVNLLPNLFFVEIKSKRPQPLGLNAVDEIVSVARKQVFEITRNVRAALIFTKGSKPPPQPVLRDAEFSSLVAFELPPVKEPHPHDHVFKARPAPNFLRPQSPADPQVQTLEKAAREYIKKSLVGDYTLPKSTAAFGACKLAAKKIHEEPSHAVGDSDPKNPEAASNERMDEIMQLVRRRRARRRKAKKNRSS